jgi:hypothetical protein
MATLPVPFNSNDKGSFKRVLDRFRPLKYSGIVNGMGIQKLGEEFSLLWSYFLFYSSME